MLFEVITECQVNVVSEDNLKRWHRRLGHLNVRAITKSDAGAITGVSKVDLKNFFCEACQMGKSHRKTCRKVVDKRNCQPGDIFHGDICGAMQVDSLGGARYFLLLKDEATVFRYVYFLKQKSNVYECFKDFEKLVHNQRGKSMLVFRVDRGTEFINEHMKKYLRNRGIFLETSAPFTPQQNGRIERDNCTIMESARSMLAERNLPKHLWAEAVNTAVYVLNRASINEKKMTPFEE